MILLPSLSPALVADGVCRIDRKFHMGACAYSEALDAEIVAILPELRPDDAVMDFVELPLDEMPYRLEIVRCDRSYRLDASEVARVENLVQQATVIYGDGFLTSRFARKHGIPYVPIVEYNLRTNLEIARLSTPSALRKVSRAIKALGRFVGEIRTLKGGHSIHCNGYPVYRQSKRFNPDSLLYLDSRMSQGMVITTDELDRRIDRFRSGERPRLIYSGRYEALKGAADVVEIGIELVRRGVDAEVHLYGKGSQRDAMRARVRQEGCDDRVIVHDAVPYPELVGISKESDLFVCCHVQDDPSCSYLEAFGSGLPIVGYANAMWRELAEESEAGVATPLRDRRACAEAIAALLKDPDRYRRYAQRAREFAVEHSFEREFAKRIDRIRELYESRAS